MEPIGRCIYVGAHAPRDQSWYVLLLPAVTHCAHHPSLEVSRRDLDSAGIWWLAIVV